MSKFNKEEFYVL